MRYTELGERLRMAEAKGDVEKRDRILREIVVLHRQRVAMNDAFVLRCEKALNKEIAASLDRVNRPRTPAHVVAHFSDPPWCAMIDCPIIVRGCERAESSLGWQLLGAHVALTPVRLRPPRK